LISLYYMVVCLHQPISLPFPPAPILVIVWLG
jgi:hypothetical protein